MMGSFEKDPNGLWRRASAGSVGLGEMERRSGGGLGLGIGVSKSGDQGLKKDEKEKEETEEVLMDDPEEVDGRFKLKTEDEPVIPTLNRPGGLGSTENKSTVGATDPASPDPVTQSASGLEATPRSVVDSGVDTGLAAPTRTAAKTSTTESQEKVEQKGDESDHDSKVDQSKILAVEVDHADQPIIEQSNEVTADATEEKRLFVEAGHVESNGSEETKVEIPGEQEEDIEVDVDPRDVGLPETPAGEEPVENLPQLQGDTESEPLDAKGQDDTQSKETSDGLDKPKEEVAEGVRHPAENVKLPSIPSSSSLSTSPSKTPSKKQQDKHTAAKTQGKATKTATSSSATPLRQQKTGGGLPLPKPSTPIVRVTKGSAPPSSYNRSPPTSTSKSSTRLESKPLTPSAQPRVARKSLTPSQADATPLRPSHTGSIATSSPSTTTTPLRPHHTGSITPLRPQATGTRAIERSPLYAPTASSLAKTKQKVTAASPGSVGSNSRTGSIGKASGVRKGSVGSGSDAGTNGGSPAMRSRVISNGSVASSGMARQSMGSEE